MLWDLFCRVIDNFGDIGVCWRLAADLGARGHTVRLWVDDASALSWMAPHVQWRHGPTLGMETGQGHPGVTVCRWSDAANINQVSPGLLAGDVVVEAFGCDPPDAFVSRMQARTRDGRPPQWINLEYLSAEDYVERSHGLRSPVWSGAGAGLSKRFFYPGFTRATGGLLREPDVVPQLDTGEAFQDHRAQVFQSLGLPIAPREKAVLVFCYGTAPLGSLLSHLDAHAPGTHLLLTPGHASELARRWTLERPTNSLHLHHLPLLPQPMFDKVLACADLNLVRGEDSAVRALWAGRPHIWQIYEQDDGVHARKLEAFMARWMGDWPAALQAEVRAWWLAWNQLGPMPDMLPDWQGTEAAWASHSRASRAYLLAQQDLTTQLTTFVTSSG